MASDTQRFTRFRDRSELLDFLLEVAEATSESLDLDRLMERVAAIIQDVVSFDLFAILLFSEKERGLRVRYSIGHRKEVVEKLLIPLTEGLTGAAASALQPVLCGDVRTDPRYLPTIDAVRTELAVPMVARGRIVGVIDLQSSQLNAYLAEETNLVQLIASRVAVAIDNARLYRRVVKQNRTLRTLATLAHTFSSTLDLDDLLNRIATTVRKLINYDAFSILLVDGERQLLRSRFSLRYDERVELDNIPLGQGITGAAVESKRTVRVEDTRNDPRYIEVNPGTRSEMAVPLLLRDRVLGVMDLEKQRLGYFTEDHVQTLTLLAPLIANSVENARLYEEIASREQRSADNLRAARLLQEALLLREPPGIAGLDVAVRSRPAREISGDVYDFFEHAEGVNLITLGDVSGKGAAAALYGALVNGLLHTLAPRTRRPGALLRSINAILVGRKVQATYVTLLVLLWESGRSRLTLANAGMFPPIICRAGRILKQRVEGIPLGLLEDSEYDETTVEVLPGDVVLLYSDGIPDQQDAACREYGRAPLYGILERTWDQPAASIAAAVVADLDEFMAGAEIGDDQTLMVLKVG